MNVVTFGEIILFIVLILSFYTFIKSTKWTLVNHGKQVLTIILVFIDLLILLFIFL